ncbi:magnesium transporter MRS2-F [Cajanus cajan]|uniref:magnesium transporter MRS2-F n=1 Tax=Cajanus cajan TaxID=3821 RepID=UPI0010FBADCC|nr:magnesium transporter MRS2-F [Cajanus cajan]
MVVSETGPAHLEDVGKLSIMRRTGLPARDLRVLDPMLSHSSSILGRERAIVVNLEHVKAIITASEVLIINSSNPFFQTFLQDLHTRLTNQTPSPRSNDMDGKDSLQGGKGSGNGSPVRISEDSVAFHVRADSSKINAEVVTGKPAPKQLPFEFRALETCIESACRCLESETSTLEKEAYPALDELTSQLSTLNLERVRQIKSRLVALSGRVQKNTFAKPHVDAELDDSGVTVYSWDPFFHF